MTDQPKELNEDALYDILHQLSLAITDDHGQDIKSVYGGLSLQALVTDWIYDQLKQPDAPEVDYDDPDVEEVLGYLDANIPAYIEALCQVVTNWESLGANGETIKQALLEYWGK